MSAYHVGPWVGEFGWLCLWQAYVRARAAGRHVIHYGASEAAPLFTGIDIEFRDHPFTGARKQLTLAGDTALVERQQWLQKQAAGADTLFPDPAWTTDWVQDCSPPAFHFIRYQATRPCAGPRVLVHARHRQDYARQRNLPLSWWQEFATLIPRENMATFGTAAYGLPDVPDYRALSMDELLNRMVQAAMVVGNSSGPMVLALLCGVPIVTWGTPDLARYYTSTWNPFGTPVTFLPATASPTDVAAAVRQSLGRN